ncbi:MAG: ester cyclase [Actinomycetota bacterium]|nr:ester cyclase [Actinomycetota bacterium]
MKELVAGLRSAIPDLHSPLLDVTAEDDRVAVRFSWRGTHGGEFDGISPTGRPVNVQGSALYRVAEGRIVEAWADFDTVSLLRQLGALPGPSVVSG